MSLAAALLLTACDGDTLYDGSPTEPGPGGAALSVSTRGTAPERITPNDHVTVRVTGRGGSGGVATLGATLLAIDPARRDTLVFTESASVLAQDSVTLDFTFPLSAIDAQALPSSLVLEAYGWATDARGECVASVSSDAQSLACAEFKGAKIAGGKPGQVIATRVVRGFGVPLPAAESVIADALVDVRSGKLFLSNKLGHRLEVMDLATLTFGAPVRVGAEPWGMSMNRTGDTLIVANSGGINVSFVPTASLREDVGKRFEIPRVILYQLKYKEDATTGARTFEDLVFFNYADRPQHVAQDAAGRLLYSALGTQAAPVGTIRVAEFGPGYQDWNTRLIFHQRALTFDSTAIAIANADSMSIARSGATVIYDHVPGSRPRQPIVARAGSPEAAISDARAQGSDVIAFGQSAWRVPESVEMADTTYVAASTDRRWIVFGENPSERAGRIMMWSAEQGRLSQVEDIADVTNNTADQFSAIELNSNGSLGTAKGKDATYFFGNDLRLQGLARDTRSGARGAALLPGSTGVRTHAFVGTGNRAIRIVETTHYLPVTDIPVRDNIVGPLRVATPRPGTQACPADFMQGPPECVVSTAYGITDAGTVIVVDILRRDFN